MKQIIDYLIAEGIVANYSQLSKQLGVSHATVLRWLSGENRPSGPSCMKLANIARLPLSYFMWVVYGGKA